MIIIYHMAHIIWVIQYENIYHTEKVSLKSEENKVNTSKANPWWKGGSYRNKIESINSLQDKFAKWLQRMRK